MQFRHVQCSFVTLYMLDRASMVGIGQSHRNADMLKTQSTRSCSCPLGFQHFAKFGRTLQSHGQFSEEAHQSQAVWMGCSQLFEEALHCGY